MTKKYSRRAFLGTALGSIAAYSAFSSPALIGKNANGKVRIGVLGCGTRGTEVSHEMASFDDADIAALFDPDSLRLGKLAEVYPKAKTFDDPRKLIEDPNLDAVLVTTCNHWHCYAAVLAMMAGKDVYVEKPLAHNQWEGAQVVKAARKFKRVCQVGTQQRSDPMQAEIKQFLHEDKAIGEIQSCLINHFSIRHPIGKRSTPLPIPETVNYDLWLGPAEDQPLFRNQLQYDWHWDWNTGNGEMGNWGVHVIDDVINNVVLDKCPLPKGITAGGARTAYNDAGQTPNVAFVAFDIGSFPIVFGMSTLAVNGETKTAGDHPGPGSGNVVYCEGGRLEAHRGGAAAYDKDGKEIRKFDGTSGQHQHARNFLDAVLSQDSSILNAEAAIGNSSSGWCNLANVGLRIGLPFKKAEAMQACDGPEGIWGDTISRLSAVVESYGLDTEKEFKYSTYLPFDTEKEVFTGELADAANAFLKRSYRTGFPFPAVD